MSAKPTLLLAVALIAAAACGRPVATLAPVDVAVARSYVSADVRQTVVAVDALLDRAWTGVDVAPEADDATFLRRAYLDLNGTIPDVATARAFIDDADPGKRGALLDRLLEGHAFARHATNYWDDQLMAGRDRLVDRVAFRRWLYATLRANTPYDEWVRALLTAKGVNSDGGRQSMVAMELEPDAASPPGVNGAVNFVLRGARAPQDLAGVSSRVFLGVQIQCAECHDHPTEKWTQDDFKRFASAFTYVDGELLEKGNGVRRIAVDDAARPNRRIARRTGYGRDTPTALDGTVLDGSALDGDNPRAALAQWMTAADNPWFVRAIVNRMWGTLLGRGFIEPIDDIRADSVVEAPEILALLSRDFVDHGFDLRRLVKVIASTKAYQRAPRANAAAWSGFAMRPMNDVQLLDAMVTATQIEPVVAEVAGDRLPRVRARLRQQFRFAFDVDEDASADVFTGTISQALMLMNGALATAGTNALEGSTVGAAARLPGGPSIEHLVLAALSRRPTSDELARFGAYVADASLVPSTPSARARAKGPVARVVRQKRIADATARDAAYEDVMWALLNSSEFFFIH
jgi:hypothetical protein